MILYTVAKQHIFWHSFLTFWLVSLHVFSSDRLWTDLLAGKIDWLIRLGPKLKCDVSAVKLKSDTSGNSLSILGTSFRISSQMSISFSCTDLYHFHSNLNHFQQTFEKRKQSTCAVWISDPKTLTFCWFEIFEGINVCKNGLNHESWCS